MIKFLFDKTTNKFQIGEGEYKFTTFKFKNVEFKEKELHYNVEIDEFWRHSGKVQNAHENELQEFITNEALDILKQLIKAQIVLNNLENDKE